MGMEEMNKKHFGRSFFDDVKEWEDKNPDFRRRVNEAVVKRKRATVLKEEPLCREI